MVLARCLVFHGNLGIARMCLRWMGGVVDIEYISDSCTEQKSSLLLTFSKLDASFPACYDSHVNTRSSQSTIYRSSRPERHQLLSRVHVSHSADSAFWISPKPFASDSIHRLIVLPICDRNIGSCIPGKDQAARSLETFHQRP